MDIKLYVIRHGQSLANSLGQHAGWAQVPLTEQGQRDALEAGRILRDVEPDAVYSSDLLRARQTAAIALPGREPILTELLREIDVGDLAGKSAALCRELYGPLYTEKKAVLDYTPFGGENAASHMARAAAFLELVEQSGHGTVAAFCHDGTLRSLHNYVRHLPASDRGARCKNGGVCLFVCHDGAWSLEGWELS